jgi:hypothetical protein
MTTQRTTREEDLGLADELNGEAVLATAGAGMASICTAGLAELMVTTGVAARAVAGVAFLAGAAFLATAFLAGAAFFATTFLAGAAFFAGAAFLTTAFVATAFLATAFLTGAFLAADFLAVFLTATVTPQVILNCPVIRTMVRIRKSYLS